MQCKKCEINIPGKDASAIAPGIFLPTLCGADFVPGI